MAEYSTNYTQNTTSYTFGTEVYKFSRTVDVINPSAIDNTCIYCGAENGSMYDYYPTYQLGTAEKAIMNNKWSASGGTFNFQKSATATPYNITFVKCGETGTANERGTNTVYQIGKTIYNKASSASNSSMRVLNPTDIRKLIFRPTFSGYTASPSSTMTGVDLKYLMEHPDDFFVQLMTMTVYAWNGSTFTNDSEIQSIRPCIVGENYFIPVVNVLGTHVFGMTDYNSRRDYTQSFYGTYDKDNMPMSFVPILTDETLTYNPDGSSGGGSTPNNNKWKWSYNYYNSTYEIYAPARQVIQLMAFCGCYFCDNSYSTSGKNLNTFWNDEHIYLGEMKEGARTTGVFIKGTELLTSDTINKGEYSSQTDFNPSPSPSPSGDDAEAETFGWGGNEVAGMVRYYLLSQSEMESLQAYMSNPNWRMDYRNCIIGMYVVPNGGLFFDAPVSTTLKFRIGLNESGGVIPQDQELDTGISCLRISGVVNNESAVIELPRINDNFLDFEPYSKYMVYVPFCGVIPLPDYVAGKEIKVTIYPDVPTCTCTAVVTSEGRKIATAKGAYGSQLPVTSDGDGLKAASVINSLGNIIMGAGEVALGIGTGMVPLAIAGGAQMLGSGLQADLQLGQAFGYSIGASGDTSFFGAGNRCEYYVAYSKWNNPDIDEGEEQTNIYGHTYGFVCNKRGLLKDFEGFTVCDNPHVYGFSCTSDEKDEIERLLREGIIIHMHEE